jgi:hypothetical protein
MSRTTIIISKAFQDGFVGALRLAWALIKEPTVAIVRVIREHSAATRAAADVHFPHGDLAESFCTSQLVGPSSRSQSARASARDGVILVTQHETGELSRWEPIAASRRPVLGAMRETQPHASNEDGIERYEIRIAQNE